MTTHTIKIAPPYCLFYLSGTEDFNVPFHQGLTDIPFTKDCVSVPCLSRQDGDTKVTVGPIQEVQPKGLPVFDNFIETPDKVVIVSDAEVDAHLTIETPSTRTRIRLWTNHPSEPDQIIVGLG